MGIEKADFNFFHPDIEADTTESSHLLPKTQKLPSETWNSFAMILGIAILCLCLVEVGGIIGGYSILRLISKYKRLKLYVFKFYG